MIYVYAVTEGVPSPAARDGVGLADQELRVVAAPGLAAVVSDHPGGLTSPSETELWAHERAVERLMADGAVLPMRFGSLLPDEDAVRALLNTRRAELTTGLARVAGAIELGVRAVWRSDGGEPEQAPEDRTSGSGYLQALVGQRRRARALAERIDTPLARLARDSRHRLLLTANLPLSGAYLVDRERLDAFRTEVVALDEQISQAEIMCTGPWPPYSFAAASPEAA